MTPASKKKSVNISLVLKVVAGVLLLFIIYELNRTFSLYYPDHLFQYENPYLSTVLYSNEPVEMERYLAVEQLFERMEPVEIFDPGRAVYIYFIEDHALYSSFAEKLGLNSASQGLTISPLGYILVNLTAVRQTEELYGERYPHTLYSGDLVHILSHEFVHVLLGDELGFFTYRSLDSWKQEGYAEYAASIYSKQQDSLYSFAERVDRYLTGYYAELSEEQNFYIRSGLVVEFLMEEEQLSFDEVMRMEEDLPALFRRLEMWRMNSR